MDNQQPSTLEERMYFLAMNAKFGDGTFWKHPECKDHKIIFTSTTPELLEVKMRILPEMFGTKPRILRKENHPGCYKNSKALYYLQSYTHPVFTYIHIVPKEQLISQLTKELFSLWYLDDGCCVKRKDALSPCFRISLSVGNTCNTTLKEELFKEHLTFIFETSKIGQIVLNNSKASIDNKSWIIPKSIAYQILEGAKKYNILGHKFPYGKGSETIPCGVGGQGQAPRSIASSLRELKR